MKKLDKKLAIIGLGYVGLPLAAEFSKKGYSVIGFDVNHTRLDQLKKGIDSTDELSTEELAEAKTLQYTSDVNDLEEAQIYIITVPTPITTSKTPNLTPLQKASETVGKSIKKGDIVIYESTVFPGCTEEECIPILEKISGLKYNQDFYAGYSPERINPGDKLHRVNSILKVTSGSTPKIAEEVNQLYASIIDAGTFLASSIRVAEAAKVIENSQRDINIAFVNELQIIFDQLDIDVHEVLEAAGTKWNFLPFQPGLVGGHCIGVDPYYLTHKAQSIGYHPEVILAGRRINDGMGTYFAKEYLKKLVKTTNKPLNQTKTLILGITFKENCPDIRNSRVIDIIEELQSLNLEVVVYDPIADPEEVKREYGIDIIKDIDSLQVDGTILAVAHKEFKTLTLDSPVYYSIKKLTT